ncbi:MAG TPA: hypothetical protein VMN36_15930 [Verrucomicrobiales bacterium]|nr:hypothetical protein [Verrucomicrobiales bacterium]
MNFLASNRRARWLVLLAVGASVVYAGAQDSSLEVRELRTALDAAVKRNRELDRENQILAEGNRVLGESLAEANRELEQCRKDCREAVLQLEALGAEAINTEGGGLEGRLMKALSDLRLADEEKEQIAREILRLSDAVVAYLSTASNASAEKRLEVENALRSAEEALGLSYRAGPVAAEGLNEARVISVKPEYSLVVCSVGSRHGLRVGTPLRIQRKDRLVGRALVVDSREEISGAVIQDLVAADESIEVGDSIFIDPEIQH